LKEATQVMVSGVVSLQMRKIFVEVRKAFSNARGSERVFVKDGLVKTSEPDTRSGEGA